MNHDLDPFIGRAAIKTATTLSFPTIHRLQKQGQFPKYEQISPGRVGLRKSVLARFLSGERDWSER